MNPKILVVDDEPDVLRLVEIHLLSAGFRVLTAESGLAAVQSAKKNLPDLIILDLMLPELDGFEVCKQVRSDPATAPIPIIMLTAKAAEIDRVLGLEIGADDYVTKPFSPRELVLRVKKQLRRGQANVENGNDILRFADVSLDVSKHQVTVAGLNIGLTATEFKLLAILMQRRGRVQSREQLLRDVWEYDTTIDSRTVDTHMRRLRQKLGASAAHLDTIRGVGYRLNEEG